MRNSRTGEIDTKHNTSPIPFWFVTPDNHRERDEVEIVRNQTEIQGLSVVYPFFSKRKTGRLPDHIPKSSLYLRSSCRGSRPPSADILGNTG